MKTTIQFSLTICAFVAGNLLLCKLVQAQIDFSSLNQWKGLGNQRPSDWNTGAHSVWYRRMLQQLDQEAKQRSLDAAQKQKEMDAATEAERAKETEADALAQQGVADYNNKDYAAAEQQFLKYLQLYPDNAVVLNSLANTRCGLAIAASSRGDYAGAITYLQSAIDVENGLSDPDYVSQIQANLQSARQMLQMQKTMDEQHKRVLAAEARNRDIVNGINNIAANEARSLTPVNANGLDVNSFNSSNTTVVDGRGPIDLPKHVDNAIAGAFHDASPDAVNRIRKGMQAVMMKDWKVANAWFGDALNHDPNNPHLKAFLKTFRDAIQSPDVPGFPTGDKTKSSINPANEDEDLRSFATDTDPGWQDRARANRVKWIKDLEDYVYSHVLMER